MSQPPPTAATGSTGGLITGHLLRLIREQLGLTQDGLAEHLGQDLNTIRSWESGRRPLGRASYDKLHDILDRLLLLGANQNLLARFGAAAKADRFINRTLEGHTATQGHPLATWVSTREWNDVLGWALVGHPNGDNPQPRLPSPQRRLFYDTLRAAAEQATGDRPSAVLLRRQVYFLAARDDTPAGRDWIVAAERREQRHLRRSDGWNPTWVAARSLAVAHTFQGDPGQLRDFITHRLAGNDLCEAANLNYWAYWIGETRAQAVSDDFMATNLGQWRGTALLSHLTAGLHNGTPYLDLLLHSLWALLERRPHLLHDDAALTAELGTRIRALLDTPPPHLGELARRELDQIYFATRMTTAKGTR